MKRNKHLSKTFTLQKDQTDCGVGCLLSLIRYYGGDNTLENLREKVEPVNKEQHFWGFTRLPIPLGLMLRDVKQT